MELLPIAALLRSYNLVAVALGETEVRKFADKPTALKRLAAVIGRAQAAGCVVTQGEDGFVLGVSCAHADLAEAKAKIIDALEASAPLSGNLSEQPATADYAINEGTNSAGDPASGKQPSKVDDEVREGATTLNLSLRIEVLVANPKRKGSRSEKVFEIYRSGMTGAEYVAEMIRAGYGRRLALAALHWDLDHGFINLA